MRPFSVSAPTAFPMRLMCLGRDKLEYHLADYKKRSDSLSKAEQDTLRDMRIVQEMYARGYDFMPIDIYRAQARPFPGYRRQADAVPKQHCRTGAERGRALWCTRSRTGPFLSREDFRARTKVSKTICDLMSGPGASGGSAGEQSAVAV